MSFPPGIGTPDDPAHRELLQSLRRLVSGLSALFWGVPIALIVCIQTAKSDALETLNILPPLLTNAWLFYALCQLGYFHPKERIWIRTIHRAKELALIQIGLGPFLFWYSHRPNEHFFAVMTGIMAVVALLFLDSLNRIVYRITAMLPDEGLREETRHFTALNRYLLLGILLVAMLLTFLLRTLPVITIPWLNNAYVINPESLWLLVFVALLPLAMTMALIWKIKEAILFGVFGGG